MNPMRYLSRRSVLALAGLAAVGSTSPSTMVRGDEGLPTAKPVRPTIKALHTATPLVIDGRLTDPIWKLAPAYPLVAMPARPPGPRKVLREAGKIRFAWDSTYFYMGAELVDSDVVAQGQADGLPDFQLGDVCELFLRPPNETGYWELYVTPNGLQTTYFFPGPGRLGLPNEPQPNQLHVAAQVQGTLNYWQDRDQGWTAEMAVPISMLTARGEHFSPEAPPWRLLVGRYNYSRYLPEAELSSLPRISAVNFHLVEEYAYLHLMAGPTSNLPPAPH